MFTGLIEEIGEVLAAAGVAEGRRFRLRATRVREGMSLGDSVAINGVCQTVAALPAPDAFEVVAVGETLRRTTFERFRPGSPVNLERPLRAGDRLGGHWVNGHVDGTARIEEIVRGGRDLSFRIGLAPEIARYVVEKGSIAVDGVSLTVGLVEAASFRVHIIPETLERTLFRTYRVGDAVNLEVDILAKYVERALGIGPGSRGGEATLRKLEAWHEEDPHGYPS